MPVVVAVIARPPSAMIEEATAAMVIVCLK